MTRKMIPVEESFAKWRKDPAYRRAYEALEDEFARAKAMIRLRGPSNTHNADAQAR